MDWTDETIARLRELWDQGLSTAEIGRQLEITKNAVVGKAHRLGLPPRPSPIRSRKNADGTTEVPRRKPPTRSKPKPKVSPEKAEDAAQGSLLDTSDAKKTEPVAQAKGDVKPAPVPAGGLKKEAVAAPAAKVVQADVAPSRPAVAAPKAAVKAEGTASNANSDEDGPKRALSSVVGHSGAPRMAPAIDRPVRRGPACCWPFGDPGTPGFHFCGARPLSGKPYCAEHAAIAYVKIRDRRD
ncbi:hypothetical protein AA106555_0726 [Neokomagataea thailandica NBRC 106555]|uniref:GcrA cell cycle regulator n=2 Tax=Neokomagataea TaxID=1223423 RepID=A0A4Y6V988_9PROT|nr:MULTISPECIES: GcrA family cell cycle regulator [Neokomagataea]QDH25181.1 GcrA cell cycle regulator [Neokomagataea tanensis]GBR51905.1 hypothetical protein AA106555_0726 [Neokomagataea thailandica NBRC 106555]